MSSLLVSYELKSEPKWTLDFYNKILVAFCKSYFDLTLLPKVTTYKDIENLRICAGSNLIKVSKTQACSIAELGDFEISGVCTDFDSLFNMHVKTSLLKSDVSETNKFYIEIKIYKIFDLFKETLQNKQACFKLFGHKTFSGNCSRILIPPFLLSSYEKEDYFGNSECLNDNFLEYLKQGQLEDQSLAHLIVVSSKGETIALPIGILIPKYFESHHLEITSL